MSTEKPGVYAIRNTVNGKVYVGGCSNLSKRWSRHRADLAKGVHTNRRLQADWLEHGKDAFSFDILELTADLKAREQFWMDQTRCYDIDHGYNVCRHARTTLGRPSAPRSEAVRRLLSEKLKGKVGSGISMPVRRGEAKSVKLTDDDVREIRRLYGTPTGLGGKGRRQARNGGVTLKVLSERFGVSQPTLCQIIGRKLWAHVE